LTSPETQQKTCPYAASPEGILNSTQDLENNNWPPGTSERALFIEINREIFYAISTELRTSTALVTDSSASKMAEGAVCGRG